MPGFFVGLVLIMIFGTGLGWLPVLGKGPSAFVASTPSTWATFWFRDWAHLVMPAFALGWYFSGAMLRITRSGMLEVLGSDYVRTARAKGLDERAVIWKHALRNALLPVITLLGLSLPFLVSGAVITETIFSWPGIGRETMKAIAHRDVFVLTGITLLGTTMVVLGSLLADVLYAAVDPRVRLR